MDLIENQNENDFKKDINIIEVLEKISQKARQDESFLKQLKDNPHEIIFKQSGISFPTEILIEVFENGEMDFKSSQLSDEDRELSDSELDNISGGMVGINSRMLDIIAYQEMQKHGKNFDFKKHVLPQIGKTLVGGLAG